MCIAIVKQKDANITDETLRACFQANPDGAGLAFAKEGKLYYLKGIFNEDEFIQAVRKYEQESEGAMLIHCRIGTSGLKDKENCHPHVINEHCVMIHNGILDIDVPKESKISDTVLYVEKHLRNLPERFMDNKEIMRLISNDIGVNNKFCFLNEKGEYAIANEREGEWENGVWYSNDNYKWGMYNSYGCGYYGYYGDELLQKEVKKEVENKLLSMSVEEILSLGQYPIVNVYTGQLRKDKKKYRKQTSYCYLDEASEDMYELFEELYREALTISKQYKTAI